MGQMNIPAENTLSHHSKHRTTCQQDNRNNPAYGLKWWTHLRAMRDLTKSQRHILAQIIEAESGPDGYCWLSWESLAFLCGCTERTVATAFRVLRADGTIFVEPGGDRPWGRGHLPSKVRVNWEHARWKDCPLRKWCSVPAPVGVQHEKIADENISTSVDIRTVVVSQEQPTDQNQNRPVEAEKLQAPEACNSTVKRQAEAEAANFAAGAASRHVAIRPEDVVFLLGLLIRANIDRLAWLKWCQSNESPHKGRNPKALLTHLVRKYQAQRMPNSTVWQHGLRSRRE